MKNELAIKIKNGATLSEIYESEDAAKTALDKIHWEVAYGKANHRAVMTVGGGISFAKDQYVSAIIRNPKQYDEDSDGAGVVV